MLDLSQLPEWAKIEVSKGDLLAFANSIITQTSIKTPTPSVSHKEILTIEEASQFLNLAKQTLYGMTSRNEIPFLKKSRKLYFNRTDLENWLQEGKRKSKDEIAIEAAQFVQSKKVRRVIR